MKRVLFYVFTMLVFLRYHSYFKANASVVIIFFAVFLLSACNNKPDDTNKTATGDSTSVSSDAAKDPLPSWNDVSLKKDIIDFVNKTTKEGSADFIPVENRIATFDNDGTLWAERPYVQELFAFYRVKKMVAANPALAKKQPFKAVIEGDKAFFAKGWR